MRVKQTLTRWRFSTLLCVAALIGATVTAAPAVANPTTPIPVCAGAKDQVIDVTQDVLNQPYVLAKDGHMWANFSYTQHLRIWTVGAHMYCIRKDIAGTWVSIAGLSPGLTGTISDGLTGTFTDTRFWEWTGTLSSTAPRSGYLGVVHADCAAPDQCADDSYLLADTFYFPPGSTQHCNSVLGDVEIDGGAHGHISLIGTVQRVTAIGDITS